MDCELRSVEKNHLRREDETYVAEMHQETNQADDLIAGLVMGFNEF